MEQEQEYESETKDNILKDLKEKLKQNIEWLSNFEKVKEEQVKRLTEMLEQNKIKLTEENKFLEEGITLWENAK